MRKKLTVPKPHGDEQTFGPSARMLRISVGLTQRQVAERIGVSRSLYTRFELGQVRLPDAAYGKLLNVVVPAT